MEIYKISDLDLIQFSNLNTNTNRIRITKSGPGNTPLFMQLPSLRPIKLTSDGTNYELCFSTNAKTPEQTLRFTDFVFNLDRMCVQAVLQHRDQIHLDRYKTTLNNYNDTPAFSFFFNPDNRQKTKIYNENKEIVHPETLLGMEFSKTYIRSIVELRSINIQDGVAFLDIVPHQFQLLQSHTLEPEPMLDEYSFLNTEYEQ